MASDELALMQGTLELLVLETLAAKDELHGFGILDWILEATDGELTVEEGALYPALHRMERRGWLASDWGVSEKGRRARYYRMTPAGRDALEREEARWNRYVGAVARIVARATRA
jgi:transcriptional regulator